MIEEIINGIAAEVAALPWVSRTGGITRAVRINDNGVTRTLPAAKVVGSGTDAPGWMIPDSNDSAIVYFEEVSTATASTSSLARIDCITSVRLVLWANLQRIDADVSTAMAKIIATITERPANLTICKSIQVSIAGFEPQVQSIVFGRYTFDDRENQQFLYPFDFASILLRIQYSVVPSCADAVNQTDPPC